jgi:hypothetical protein
MDEQLRSRRWRGARLRLGGSEEVCWERGNPVRGCGDVGAVTPGIALRLTGRPCGMGGGGEGGHPSGVRFYLVRFPVVSLVASLDHRLQSSNPTGC